jgi:uncharacterized protein YcfJ
MRALRPGLSLRPLFPVLLLAATAPVPAFAQETVIPTENVRMDYAKVLRVEPVFQTLRATRMEQRCDGKAVEPRNPPTGGISRIVGAVRNALQKPPAQDPPVTTGNCHMVAVEREFRRPIAYDVDYMYKGMKYRSRLPSDPGNRVKVRVSVTPFIAPADSH